MPFQKIGGSKTERTESAQWCNEYRRTLHESGVGLADRGRYFLVSARKYPKKPTQGVKSSSRLTREPLENPPCPVYSAIVQGFGAARGADLEKFQKVMGRKRNESGEAKGVTTIARLTDSKYQRALPAPIWQPVGLPEIRNPHAPCHQSGSDWPVFPAPDCPPDRQFPKV